jgi:hypothetical protein
MNRFLARLEGTKHICSLIIFLGMGAGAGHLSTGEHEYFFTNMLTGKVSCGMIGEAWMIPAVGMRMQRRRLPPRLTFSLASLDFTLLGKRI